MHEIPRPRGHANPATAIHRVESHQYLKSGATCWRTPDVHEQRPLWVRRGQHPVPNLSVRETGHVPRHQAPKQGNMPNWPVEGIRGSNWTSVTRRLVGMGL